MNSPQLQRGVFFALLAIVTVAFIWILMPFFGAVLWGVALAILFTPLYKWLLRKLSNQSYLFNHWLSMEFLKWVGVLP